MIGISVDHIRVIPELQEILSRHTRIYFEVCAVTASKGVESGSGASMASS